MKNLKKFLSCLVTGVFAISCTKIDNVFNGNKDSNRFGIPTENVNFKISNEPIVPKILTFESKVPIKPLKLLKKLPEGRNFDFRFEVNPKKIKKNMIKIAENGDFKLTIKKGNKFSVIDNDATDGNSTIEIPENVINTFIGIPEKDEDEHKKVTGVITIEDKLYYAKQEIKPLSKKELEAIFEKDEKEHDKKFETKKENTEKDKENNEGWYTGEREDGTWYQIGKRPLPIPSEWKSDDGIDYVLSFKNQGIKQFDFKGYKVNNPKDYEYPDGINLIGTKGGTVSLTGVGKIEIPQGALDKEIFISMKQEASAPEILSLDGTILDDYVGPSVKIEPIGLVLKDRAKLYLGIDLKRLGNNTPAITRCEYIYPDGWAEMLGYIVYSLQDIKVDTPVSLKTFGHIRRVIPTSVLPDYETGVSTIEEDTPINTFNTKSIGLNEVISALTYYFHSATPHFAFFTSKSSGISETTIEEIKARAELAYSHDGYVINALQPDLWYLKDDPITKQQKFYIPIYLFGHITQGSEKAVVALERKNETLKLINDSIYLPDASSVEHEIWHLFQHKIIVNDGASYNDFVFGGGGIYNAGKYKWVEESTAEYIGARTFKYYKDKFASSTYLNGLYSSSGIPTNYTDKLSNNLKYLESSKKFSYETEKYVSGKRDFYSEVGFFTYLANSKVEGISTMKSIFRDLSIGYSHLEQFHDFALHSKLQDLFDISFDGYSLYNIKSHENLLDNDNGNIIDNSKNPEIVLSAKENLQKTLITLENNSAKYLFFRSNYNKKNPTLGITVKTSGSGCESSSKIRVLFYDILGNNTIVLPQYLDPKSSDEKIDSKYSGMFTEDKALNLKSGQIYPFLNFGEDFSKAVLIISNSNGKLEGGNTCNYEVESCLLCFK